MGPNYFPSLLYPLTPSGFEDMMPDVCIRFVFLSLFQLTFYFIRLPFKLMTITIFAAKTERLFPCNFNFPHGIHPFFFSRDSACGVLSVSRSGDYATPLVYPALEPLYSLDALPTLSAEDLTTLFPSNGFSFFLFSPMIIFLIFFFSQENAFFSLQPLGLRALQLLASNFFSFFMGGIRMGFCFNVFFFF